MPTTTAPAGTREPSSSTTAPGSMRSTRAWMRRSAPLSAYQAVIGAATSSGQRPGERPVGGLHHGDRAARLARGGGELRADPAGTHDHDVVLLGEDRPQPLGVVQRAQQMHAGHTLGAGQPDRLRSGREDQDVVRHGTLGGVQLVVVGAHAEHFAAQPQPDVQGLEVDVEGGAVGLSEQHGLGQRRSVVRRVGFRADQRHPAPEALFPQGDRGLHPGHARAHDDDPPCRIAPRLRLLAHLITIVS